MSDRSGSSPSGGSGVGNVPVSLCSPRFHSVDVGGFMVSEVWFPPGTEIPSHTHARPVLGVMLMGGFEDRFRQRTLTPHAGESFTEPGEERHSNHVGESGARVIALQPDPSDETLAAAARPLLDEIATIRHPGVALSARRLARELREPDSVSPLAIESLALDMIVSTQRLRAPAPEPGWLRRVDELVHDSFREPLKVAEIAEEVGVHRAVLARTYKRHRGLPLGTHIRRLRLEWAAERLVYGDESLSTIAIQAGFADQSHLTRAFKRRFGVPPGLYRSTTR